MKGFKWNTLSEMLIKRHGRGTLNLASEAWVWGPNLQPYSLCGHGQSSLSLTVLPTRFIVCLLPSHPPHSIESQQVLSIHCTLNHQVHHHSIGFNKVITASFQHRKVDQHTADYVMNTDINCYLKSLAQGDLFQSLNESWLRWSTL